MVWRSIGACLEGLARGGWGCRLMPSSASATGLQTRWWRGASLRSGRRGRSSAAGRGGRFGWGSGCLFTGRLSLDAHPWLADHAVMGTVLLPGTAFLELALYVGGQVGVSGCRSSTLEAPLVLPERGRVQLQVSLGEPMSRARVRSSVYSRSLSRARDATTLSGRVDASCQGTLVASARGGRTPRTSADLASWPPRRLRSRVVDGSL